MKDKITSNDPFMEAGDNNIDKVIEILEARLPRSAHIYNMAIMSKIVPSEIKIYIYLDDISMNAWIVSTAEREDYGKDISISTPMNPVITNEIKDAFSMSNVIDWEKPYMFSALDRIVSIMILEVSSMIKNNGMSFLPQYYFYMDRKSASKLNTILPNGFNNKSLKNDSGINFLVNNWKYTLKGTKEYVDRVTKHCPSSGVYDNETGEPVTGILLNFSGLLGMLYSHEKYRGKGLGLLCMKNIIKQVAGLGFIPASSCETKNIASKAFHEKAGMKMVFEAIDIIYVPSY